MELILILLAIGYFYNRSKKAVKRVKTNIKERSTMKVPSKIKTPSTELAQNAAQCGRNFKRISTKAGANTGAVAGDAVGGLLTLVSKGFKALADITAEKQAEVQ